jgi:hypothetical protein
MSPLSPRSLLAVSLVTLATTASGFAQASRWAPQRLSPAAMNELSGSMEPQDQSRLCDHFLVVAADHDAEADRHDNMARALAGNAGRATALVPGAHCRRLATSARRSAIAAQELASHLDRLAAGEFSVPPADAVWEEPGAPARPTSYDGIMTGVVTAEDHEMSAAFFDAEAAADEALARRYAAKAAQLRGRPNSRGLGGNAAEHWQRLADRVRRSAKGARMRAAAHQKLADSLPRN